MQATWTRAGRKAGRWDLYRPAVRAHARLLLFGLGVSVVLVLVRLALPWPFKVWILPWLDAPTAEITPVLFAGAAFVVLFSILGIADYGSRILFARFAVEAMRDVRRRVFFLGTRESMNERPGELVSRLIGDTARVRESLKGFLIHVATNGLLFLGVSAVLFFLDYRLGIVMFLTFLATLGVTAVAGARILRRAGRLRRREGRLAEDVRRWWERMGWSAGRRPPGAPRGESRASLTRIQGQAAWVTHGLLALSTLLCLYLLNAGETAPSGPDTFLVLIYAVTLHHPVVRLCRQGTRIGKMLACARRIERAVDWADPDRAGLPLLRELRLEGVAVREKKDRGGRERIRGLDLAIRAGEKVAIVGGSGAGKSSLLRTILRPTRIEAGKVTWDDKEWASGSSEGPRPHAHCFSAALDRATWTPTREDWEQYLAGAGAQHDGVFLLDDPFAGLGPREAAERVEELLQATREGTVLVCFSHPVSLHRFDRVLVLEKQGTRPMLWPPPVDSEPADLPWPTWADARLGSGA